ncbi:DUF4176 domain-containing protein [Aneurinibacillus thermoaerophilus]|uniref:DUF4176 domain-containing protein n=1 Tax=Aneurinibacillus thermoaerophilus TaxID=143495 RepID=UPI002E1F8ECA|nr:DUF4176 domain-containing protein [Aneurinibacillus thermoaerophilus]MED0757046.1 DUF4176 domain-containing protein [Aneurinibacillus thermoaerophilus]MED0762659.1 DUF4176 domain-containing protein [Aneurinibacillus thermoaerophilus]MED0766316.1 DUF4176 domain-containing protein [Aneurinibacillus thermoaerophilus]
MKRLLPLGSVVLLKEGTKRVMIYGRIQRQADNNKIWDYIACLYPEGNIDPNQAYLFDHEQIDTVCFTGYQDMEEIMFNQEIQAFLENQQASGEGKLGKG